MNKIVTLIVTVIYPIGSKNRKLVKQLHNANVPVGSNTNKLNEDTFRELETSAFK